MNLKAFVSLLIVTACSSPNSEETDIKQRIDDISENRLKTTLNLLASDRFEGRRVGTAEDRAAAEYLANQYDSLNIQPLTKANAADEPYFQYFSIDQSGKKSQNVIAFIEGTDDSLKKKVIVLVAHYDHLGKDTTLSGDQVYNGAADDASGTVAVLEIARSFAAAKASGTGPKRSILFLHTSGEESGLLGSLHFANIDPLWPLNDVSAVINLDGVGGTDTLNRGKSAYVYLLQVDSTSRHLFEQSTALNEELGIALRLLTPSNPEVFYSDNRPFEDQLVPSIFFSTGQTEYFHSVRDESTSINTGEMTKVVKLAFALAWNAANDVARDPSDRLQYVMSGYTYYCRPCGCPKDGAVFKNAGKCPDCGMDLVAKPVWNKRIR